MGLSAHGSLLREAISGWSYIARRPGLLGLLVLYAATWFLGVPTEVLLQPYVLSFASPNTLGLIVSVTGAGFLDRQPLRRLRWIQRTIDCVQVSAFRLSAYFSSRM